MTTDNTNVTTAALAFLTAIDDFLQAQEVDENLEVLEDEAEPEAWDDQTDAEAPDDEPTKEWEAFFDRDTLAISFKADYYTSTGVGATKVVYDSEIGFWYFHDTFYDSTVPVENSTRLFESNLLFNQPGEAIVRAEEWLANKL